jgi:hypothetical protein
MPGKPGGNEIKCTDQLLEYADDANLLRDNIYTRKKTEKL